MCYASFNVIVYQYVLRAFLNDEYLSVIISLVLLPLFYNLFLIYIFILHPHHSLYLLSFSSLPPILLLLFPLSLTSEKESPYYQPTAEHITSQFNLLFIVLSVSFPFYSIISFCQRLLILLLTQIHMCISFSLFLCVCVFMQIYRLHVCQHITILAHSLAFTLLLCKYICIL